jgi:galactokinase
MQTESAIFFAPGRVTIIGEHVETYNGNYKKAAIIAFTDERVTKMMDPKTSDEETGRIIGKETGKVLVIVATAKAAGHHVGDEPA